MRTMMKACLVAGTLAVTAAAAVRQGIQGHFRRNQRYRAGFSATRNRCRRTMSRPTD